MVAPAGVPEPYQWLNTEVQMRDFLKLLPQVFLGRYIAVTSIDSGILRLSEEDRARGRRSEGDIAYSPMITSMAELPTETHPEYCEGYYEFYLFDTPQTCSGRWRLFAETLNRPRPDLNRQ